MSVFRKEYRALTEQEKAKIDAIKTSAEVLYNQLHLDAPFGYDPRYMALARTKLEECVMWATKALT